MDLQAKPWEEKVPCYGRRKESLRVGVDCGLICWGGRGLKGWGVGGVFFFFEIWCLGARRRL